MLETLKLLFNQMLYFNDNNLQQTINLIGIKAILDNRLNFFWNFRETVKTLWLNIFIYFLH